jgi:hypothetical protein
MNAHSVRGKNNTAVRRALTVRLGNLCPPHVDAVDEPARAARRDRSVLHTNRTFPITLFTLARVDVHRKTDFARSR